MLRSNGTWIALWRQAWEAMQKRRVKPGTEGLAANVDRVLRIGRAIGNSEFAQQHENGGSDNQQTKKQQKIWRNWTSKCQLDC